MSQKRRIAPVPEERAAWFLRSELSRPDFHLPCGHLGVRPARQDSPRGKRYSAMSHSAGEKPEP